MFKSSEKSIFITMGIEIFDAMAFLALPASGKSETRRFLEEMISDQRRVQFHFGRRGLQIDDYDVVGALLLVDKARQAMGWDRVHSHEETEGADGFLEDGGFSDPRVWEMLDTFIAEKYGTLISNRPNIHDTHTVVLECARGGAVDEPFPLEHGYQATLSRLPDELLERLSIFYIEVSPETSRRKNRERYDKSDPLSELGHMVPEKVMERDYAKDDIRHMMEQAREAGHDGYVEAKSGIWVPIHRFDDETHDYTSFVRDHKALEKKEGKPAADEQFAEQIRELDGVMEDAIIPLYERHEARPA